MSPKRRYQAPRARPRREIVKAAASALGVVAVTALLIWLLRPGPSDRFDGGGGGLFNRQPRASWLVALTAVVLGIYAWWVRSRRHRRSTPALVGAGSAVILTLAVVAGFLWPGGLLRQYATVPSFDPAELEAELADLTSTTAEPAPGTTEATNAGP